MVQVLPYVPSFGERLAPVLGNAVGNIAQGFQQRREGKSDQNILDQLVSNPNSSPMEQIKAFSSLSPQAQKNLSPLFTHFLDLQKSQAIQGQKESAIQSQKDEEKADVENTLNSLANELEEGRTGKNFFNYLTSKGRESRAYYDELALSIEKRLATMVGKGALNKERFNYLKKNLPSSSDTDATNRGKLKALAREFKVQIKNPKFKEALHNEESAEGVEGKYLISPSGKRVLIPADQVEAALSAGGKLA